MSLDRKTYFSKKIVLFNIVATMLIVILHSVPNLRFGVAVDINHPFIYVMNILCQAGVPTFFFVSSLLFYRTCSSYKDILVKLGRRVHTLLIPYLLWNTIFVAIYYVLTNVGNLPMNMGTALNSFRDIFIGIIDARFTPLWFIKILMFYSLIAPVLLFILQKRYLFLLVFIGVTIKALLCHTLQYDNFWMWLPIYMMGGYVGFYKVELRGNKTLTALFALILAMTLFLSIWDNNLLFSFRFFCPFILWFIVDWTLKTYLTKHFEVKRWMHYTFFIFCTHYFILNVLQKLVVITCCPNWMVLNATFVLTPVITVLFLVTLANRISDYRFYKILTGGR